MSSNVGSSLFIGLAGQAAIGGLAVGGYEWNVRILICKKDLLFFFSFPTSITMPAGFRF